MKINGLTMNSTEIKLLQTRGISTGKTIGYSFPKFFTVVLSSEIIEINPDILHDKYEHFEFCNICGFYRDVIILPKNTRILIYVIIYTVNKNKTSLFYTNRHNYYSSKKEVLTKLKYDYSTLFEKTNRIIGIKI